MRIYKPVLARLGEITKAISGLPPAPYVNELITAPKHSLPPGHKEMFVPSCQTRIWGLKDVLRLRGMGVLSIL